MTKLLSFFPVCLLFLFLSCRNYKVENEQIVNSPLVGTWVWNNKTINSNSGVIIQNDYGLSIGAGIKGIVISKIIFSSDKSVQNIVESKEMLLSKEKGLWKTKHDTLLINWGKGKLQISTYKIMDDSLFIYLIHSNSIIKYLKKY